MSTHVLRRRLGVGVLAATTAAMLVPTTATALDVADAEAQAELAPDNNVAGYGVNFQDREALKTLLIGLRTGDGAALRTYCVEIEIGIDDEAEMVEVPWDQYPVPDAPFTENADKILWALQHSYPVTDLDRIEQELDGVSFNDGLSEQEAITATQAAVWTFSDAATVDVDDITTKGGDVDADVRSLYEYLTGDANVGIGDQPEPALSLDPAALEGEAGELIGPFSVSTTADEVTVAPTLPDGVTVVGPDGAPLPETVTDGAEFSVDVPEDAEAGSGTVHLDAMAQLDIGRLFVGSTDEIRTQSLILAQSEKTKLEVEGTVEWKATPVPTPTETPTATPTSTETPSPTPTETPTPSPTSTETPTPSPTSTEDATPSETPTPSPSETPEGELPDTGAAPAPLLMVALVLLGGAAVLLRRRLLSAGD
ncbi:LPXTG-motif cell wall-anchored protein/TQXA domain-containing protein [Haloactinopolyspora alba]|uniref:LPXTG-motif cell wall-anchored protein/TQXA domain-containing protein n=1 Tax=Haloactinopolyspora alba TaxID=648780 RepID=A0A2P8EFW0_9ACTN|nr:Cys-Gln thioester bond-forming surface protein [Haloactinopolyspora alba]PSL08358.1 LPXTG-motif cell wall-anchored protein/TQXA domain-containing protein [Haloactinopolyspora alba]